MPRGRGGRRAGAVGKPYANRSDLQKQVPVAAPAGRPYGQRQATEDAQRVAPVASPPTTPSAEQGASYPPPGSLGDFARPTEFPGEPMTAGNPLGPGPGREALPAPPNPADADVVQMAKWLPTLELAASQPGASVSLRNFVRRLRGANPVGGRA